MIGKHPLLISCDDEEIIWRYISFDKYESLLTTGCLFFCRADKFADQFEGSIPKKEAEHRPKEYKAQDLYWGREHDENMTKTQIEALAEMHREDKKFTMVNCWHINKLENDGMWKLYLKDNEGVAIRTTKKRLENSLKDAPEEILFSKIRYLDYENDVWFHAEEFPHNRYNTLVPLFHKRKEFAHEQELRAFHQVPFNHELRAKYWDDKPSQKGILIKVNVTELVEAIYFAPNVEDRIRSNIMLVANHQGYDNFVFKESVLQSKPYF
jgi:hypothetical protein